MNSITNNRIIILGATTLARKLSEVLENSRLAQVEDVGPGDVVISTQGTNRGTSRQIIDRCFTEIVEQVESVEKIASRFIVIGSMGSEYSSWPGIDNQRMIYNISKSSLEKWMQDYNQKNFVKEDGRSHGMRIQMCEPATFKSNMSNHKGMEIEEIVDAVKYLVDHANIIKIQIRS